MWFAHLGINVGFEQDGSGSDSLRPVVIIKKFNNDICWIVPLTRSDKQSKYYFPVHIHGESTSLVILSQVRLLDGKRLKYLFGYVRKKDFKQLKTKIRRLLT